MGISVSSPDELWIYLGISILPLPCGIYGQGSWYSRARALRQLYMAWRRSERPSPSTQPVFVQKPTIMGIEHSFSIRNPLNTAFLAPSLMGVVPFLAYRPRTWCPRTWVACTTRLNRFLRTCCKEVASSKWKALLARAFSSAPFSLARCRSR